LTDLGELARELRHCPELADPARLCKALGIDEGAKRQTRGLIIRCPSHGDRTPSCSVTEGPDGTLRVKCFSCDFTADALGLVEVTLNVPFIEAINEACDLCGRPRPGAPGAAAWVPPPAREGVSRPEPRYPWASDLARFWGNLEPAEGNRMAEGLLARRAIDPRLVRTHDLARVITGRVALPEWARYRGSADRAMPWTETGHLLVLPAYDHTGTMRSVRAWRVFERDEQDVPKRLPPSGCKASGLVLANLQAQSWLRGELGPSVVVVAEGEPDYLTHATRFDGPVLGILSGSWTAEFAAAVPIGSTLLLRTDRDQAGDRYADAIAKSVGERAQIRRAVV